MDSPYQEMKLFVDGLNVRSGLCGNHIWDMDVPTSLYEGSGDRGSIRTGFPPRPFRSVLPFQSGPRFHRKQGDESLSESNPPGEIQVGAKGATGEYGPHPL